MIRIFTIKSIPQLRPLGPVPMVVLIEGFYCISFSSEKRLGIDCADNYLATYFFHVNDLTYHYLKRSIFGFISTNS
jgi:hypothetical protein